MNGRTSRLLTALHLLVVIALVATVVQLHGSRDRTPSVTVDALGTAAEGGPVPEGGEVESDATSTADGGVEGDFVGFELKWIPASDFIPDDGATIDLDSTTGCLTSNQGFFLSTSVELPDDATVSSVTFYVRDDDGSGNVGMSLSRTNTTAIAGGSAPSRVDIFSANSNDGDDSGYQALTDSDPSLAGRDVIDLNDYSYSMEVAHVGNTEFCGARITWLPESTTELTFHEVEPCAVFDTREGRGGREAPLAGLETVAFDTIMSDYSGQGGVSSSCGVPAPNGGLVNSGEGTVAVMLNLVALNPQDGGNLKAWDPDTTEPDGGILVYTGGENGNVVLPMAVEDQVCGFSPTPGCSEDGGDINVKNNGGDPVDVRGVVVGYFTKPLINQE